MSVFDPKPPQKPELTVAVVLELSSTGALPRRLEEYHASYRRYEWHARFAGVVVLCGVCLIGIGALTVFSWFK